MFGTLCVPGNFVKKFFQKVFFWKLQKNKKKSKTKRQKLFQSPLNFAYILIWPRRTRKWTHFLWGKVLYTITVLSKSANISPKRSHLKVGKMGFKMILGAWRLLIRGQEDEFAPLVVHWSTKKCEKIENLSAPKCTFIYIKMILSVSWLTWTPPRVAILVLVAEKMEKQKTFFFRNLHKN